MNEQKIEKGYMYINNKKIGEIKEMSFDILNNNLYNQKYIQKIYLDKNRTYTASFTLTKKINLIKRIKEFLNEFLKWLGQLNVNVV